MNQLSDKISWGLVCAIGILLIVLMRVLFGLADDFEYGQPPNRPILSVVWLSWGASAVALLGLFFGLRVKSNFRVLVGVIVLVAVSTRLLLVFSNPILEVDFIVTYGMESQPIKASRRISTLPTRCYVATPMILN